jgi:hypothetical protein
MLHQLTPTGGRSSGEEENISSMSITRRHSMSIKIRMLKDKRLLFIRDIMAGIRDGELFTLINQRVKQQVDSIENMDYTSTDHSSSDPDFQCRELLNSYHGMPNLRDITKVEEINRLGDSTENPTLSKT